MLRQGGAGDRKGRGAVISIPSTSPRYVHGMVMYVQQMMTSSLLCV